MVKVGLLVNPIAGCGQFLNLKGSDGLTQSQCPRSISMEKAVEFLGETSDLDVQFYTAGGQMGENAFLEAGYNNYSVIESHEGECNASHTRDFIYNLLKTDASLLVFFGGDGTARDIVDAGWILPVIGVPLGTKMYSSVFAISVQRAIDLFREFSNGRLGNFVREEVIDLDEAAYVKGNLEIKSHGFLSVPESESVMSVSKAEYPETSSSGISEYVVDQMVADVNYIIGPGSTCKEILTELGLQGSLLGFDHVRNGKLIATDISEKEIFALTAEKTIIILSPIGGQGFLLGRGNKQLSGRIVSAVGFQNIIVVSTENKMRALDRLYVDLEYVTVEKPAFIRILFGYGRYRMMRVIY